MSRYDDRRRDSRDFGRPPYPGPPNGDRGGYGNGPGSWQGRGGGFGPGYGAKRPRDDDNDNRRRDFGGKDSVGRDGGPAERPTPRPLNGVENRRDGREDTPSSAAPRVPLSLDELLRKQAEEKSADKVGLWVLCLNFNECPADTFQLCQPKFLTKEERAKIALEKRQKEVEEQRAQQDAERDQREQFLKKVEEERRGFPLNKATVSRGLSNNVLTHLARSGQRDAARFGRNDGFGRPSGYGGGDRGRGPPPRGQDRPSDKKPAEVDVNEAEAKAIRVSKS